METLEDIQQALERRSPSEQLAITRWLQGLEGTRAAGYGVGEPKVNYASEDPRFMTLEEYFEFEEHNETRHEYVNGAVFAMSGASVVHERVCNRLVMAFGNHVGRGLCQVFSNGMKLLIQHEASDICYYPDIMVDCRREAWGSNYVRSPKLVVETLSPSTSLTDRREKFQNYRTIDSLEEYVLVAQVERKLMIHRRANGWRPHVYSGEDVIADFRSIDLSLPLREIYDDILN